MELTRYQPFFSSPNRLLTSLFGDAPFERFFSSGRQSLPALNVHESGTGYEVKVAAPGLKKDQFSLSEEDGLLRISCNVEQHKETNDSNELIHEEFSYLNWSRHIQLPKAQIDVSKIKASYTEGVLFVEIPKRKEAVKSSQSISIE